MAAAEGGKDAKLQYAAEVVAEDASATAVSTYDCPVCRRAQILDLDRLQARIVGETCLPVAATCLSSGIHVAGIPLRVSSLCCTPLGAGRC
jgi:hypothetical protein